MLSYIILALATAYLALALAGFWATKRRPEFAVRFWVADLAVAVVLVALNVADRDWLLVAVWVFNAALAVVNLRFARSRREMDERWAGAFRN